MSQKDLKGFDIHELFRREQALRDFELSLGGKIKTIRTIYDLTQKEFADMIQVTHAHISKIENGKDSPSNSLLAMIISKFNISEDWINNTLNRDQKSYDRFMFNDLNIFISNLRYLQKKIGLSKREMNDLFNASAYHLDNIEYLELNGLHAHMVKKICDYFKISMYDIINIKLNNLQGEKRNSGDNVPELSKEEVAILEIYNTCSSADQKLIVGILNKFQN
jgi:transcriptional regulator with XRE-family HTH domain